jgi:multimeric flavodoxin WrbA
MKVTAFNGSPRPNGNTALLLRKALEPITKAGIETEFVQVGGTNIRGCTACMQCASMKNQRCVVEDDVFNSFYEKMLASDAILLGSPTYFTSVSSEMKALIDKAGFVAYVNGAAFSRKIGAAVVAQRRGGATHVFDTINHLFLMSRMIVPGSTYWNFGNGFAEGDAAKDEEALANMQDLGEAIAWLLGKTKA